MDDDIFLQLSSLLDGSNSSVSSSHSSGPSSPYGAEDSTMFTHDNMLVPDVKPKPSTTGRKNIVVIDDDFSTLDLMKIYLQRDYDVEVFDNPKNAIFYLNGTVPDLIFLDCYLNVMSTKFLRSLRPTRNLPARLSYILPSHPNRLPSRASFPKGLWISYRVRSNGGIFSGYLIHILRTGKIHPATPATAKTTTAGSCKDPADLFCLKMLLSLSVSVPSRSLQQTLSYHLPPELQQLLFL